MTQEILEGNGIVNVTDLYSECSAFIAELWMGSKHSSVSNVLIDTYC